MLKFIYSVVLWWIVLAERKTDDLSFQLTVRRSGTKTALDRKTNQASGLEKLKVVPVHLV